MNGGATDDGLWGGSKRTHSMLAKSGTNCGRFFSFGTPERTPGRHQAFVQLTLLTLGSMFSRLIISCIAPVLPIEREDVRHHERLARRPLPHAWKCPEPSCGDGCRRAASQCCGPVSRPLHRRTIRSR